MLILKIPLSKSPAFKVFVKVGLQKYQNTTTKCTCSIKSESTHYAGEWLLSCLYIVITDYHVSCILLQLVEVKLILTLQMRCMQCILQQETVSQFISPAPGSETQQSGSSLEP